MYVEMAMIVHPVVAHGGRFLYTVQQKQNGHIYTVFINESNTLPRCAVVAFDNREKANALAFTVENMSKKEPLFVESPHFNFTLMMPYENYEPTELYIQKWDSYHLHKFITDRNMDLMVAGLMTHKLYQASRNPHDYIDYYDAIYAQN